MSVIVGVKRSFWSGGVFAMAPSAYGISSQSVTEFHDTNRINGL